MVTLLRLPNPILCIAAVFHSGRGGINCTLLTPLPLNDSLSTPSGSVISTASALYVTEFELVRECVATISTPR